MPNNNCKSFQSLYPDLKNIPEPSALYMTILQSAQENKPLQRCDKLFYFGLESAQGISKVLM